MRDNINSLFVKWKKGEWLFVIAFTVIAFGFFGYVGIGFFLSRLLVFLTIPLMFCYCWNTFIRPSLNPYFKTMRLIVLFTIISIFSSFIFWGQSFSLGYRITVTGFVLVFYFYLCKRKPDVGSVETYILAFGLLYCALWLYAMIQFPTPVFGFGAEGELEEDLSRGINRINFVGYLSLVFAYFLSLNRAFLSRKRAFYVLSAVLFVFIVLQVTRQIIFLAAFVSIIYLFQKKPKALLLGLLLLILIFGFGNRIEVSSDSILGSLINLTETQMENNQYGEKDIRLVEYEYFFTQWSRNIITDIIGNGIPHSSSSYGRMQTHLQDSYGLYLSDVGYARIYVTIGLVGLVLYLTLFIKCCLAKLPENLMYAKLFMLYLMLSNIASSPYWQPDGQIAMSISVYLITFFSTPKIHMLKPIKP